MADDSSSETGTSRSDALEALAVYAKLEQDLLDREARARAFLKRKLAVVRKREAALADREARVEARIRKYAKSRAKFKRERELFRMQVAQFEEYSGTFYKMLAAQSGDAPAAPPQPRPALAVSLSFSQSEFDFELARSQQLERGDGGARGTGASRGSPDPTTRRAIERAARKLQILNAHMGEQRALLAVQIRTFEEKRDAKLAALAELEARAHDKIRRAAAAFDAKCRKKAQALRLAEARLAARAARIQQS
ncbi:uncharacterized protein AMSG_00352 [Thecamonas trahens ATCC 50062]|uniref:DUF4200 domain-containing protein n=1 Tax=Thecamonas trahens ATCC 50062 TaxID=461836 RepID=A0A0L0D8N8_THETB|nr:hypothetical protein AMSG_00352 [Thecamonas trahens ATCC 50062]KNC48575.1 hypothetical protein AMSG_00352 [Thecamonas trahens ATCC 50062]|eukprot:XP_013762631.1 hypothetical protein AMSG_00352 [Thecamonas trahens ATCC 50062]